MNFKVIEKKWQKLWHENNVFKSSVNEDMKKYYVLEMLPYPSGKLHMGHIRNYTIGDISARYKKSQGFNVLHPMGWDAFGLPAENAAIENKRNPREWTLENISYMRTQLIQMGFSYDWDREIKTCEPDYYGQAQKIFIAFVKHGLAYQKESYVNWDPVDQCVLANEQVIDGKGWRSDAPVEKKKLRQWYLKITAYADALLADLSVLPHWPEKVKVMQKNWIGQSYGATIAFKVTGQDRAIDVYTTRPETLYGASFVAIAPQHPLAEIVAADNAVLRDFLVAENRQSTSEVDRERAEKKGVNTGLTVVHPFMPEKTLPVFVANFVLMDYGTGAIFGCPAHDPRDFAFATKYGLPILPVIAPADPGQVTLLPLPLTQPVTEAYVGDGILVNSDFLDGLSLSDAQQKAHEKIQELGCGTKETQYRLKDWGVSRQRYWGCPIPIVYCPTCGTVPLSEEMLPLELPQDVVFAETGGNPLETHPTWKHTTCPVCDKPAVRETDTLDTFFDSSWYFARYCSPQSDVPIDQEEAKYWLSVDQYVGGIEHAILHLLYSRFFTKALHDVGLITGIDHNEPFKRLLTQGMVCHQTFKDTAGRWVYPDDVVTKNGSSVHRITGDAIQVGRSEKMSKSKKNTVDPHEMIEAYGVDAVRLFMISDSPPEKDLEWSVAGLHGVWRYLKKLDALVTDWEACQLSVLPEETVCLLAVQKTHAQYVQLITQTIATFQLNRYIAYLREFTAFLESRTVAEKRTPAYKEALVDFCVMLEPGAPHIANELISRLCHVKALTHIWPVANMVLLADQKVKYAIQFKGKTRGFIEGEPDISQEALLKLAQMDSDLAKYFTGTIERIIFVKGRLLNVLISA